MDRDCFIVHKSVLPDFYEKVLEIKEVVKSGKKINLACKEAGISRSTFYKYKDYVFSPEEKNKRLVITMKLNNEPNGIIHILNWIVTIKGVVVSINQDAHFNSGAFTRIIISVNNQVNIEELSKSLNQQRNVIESKIEAIV